MKAEALHVKLAEQVRGDSTYLADVTSAAALAPVQAGTATADIEATLAELAKDDAAFADIKSIHGPTGKVYFYSLKYMSETFARILARVKAEDPCITIAETVREESRVYPRVTNVELFKYGLFKIERDQLDSLVARTLEQHKDIKSIRTWSGSLYLYSTRYLTPDWAAFLAKKAERPDN